MTQPTWGQVVEACNARIKDLTAICIDPKSEDRELRSAQAAIVELERIKNLPDTLSATAQAKSAQRRSMY
jgi:hypothetical protein